MTPETDGIDHINVYSKGKTKLGRFLTNFAYSPINTEDGYFASIEAYWYWLGCKDDRLRVTYGFLSKQMGRDLGAKDWLDDKVFKDKIKKAIEIKINHNVEMSDLFYHSSLPFTHYYVYGQRIIKVPKAQWIIDYLTELRIWGVEINVHNR